MKRENVGKVLVGSGVVLTLLVLLTRGGVAAAAPPGGLTLVNQYLAEIAAATTYAQLQAIRYRFEADYSYGGPLNQEQYATLYSAYVARYYAIVP